MVYHVSATHGLTKLIPKISTHRKPYVYAVENETTALLFGAKHKDWKRDARFTTHYSALINGLISLMDGHLLQP